MHTAVWQCMACDFFLTSLSLTGSGLHCVNSPSCLHLLFLTAVHMQASLSLCWPSSAIPVFRHDWQLPPLPPPSLKPFSPSLPSSLFSIVASTLCYCTYICMYVGLRCSVLSIFLVSFAASAASEPSSHHLAAHAWLHHLTVTTCLWVICVISLAVLCLHQKWCVHESRVTALACVNHLPFLATAISRHVSTPPCLYTKWRTICNTS